MSKRSLPILVLLSLLFATLACNLPGAGGDTDATIVARSIEETLAADISLDDVQLQDDGSDSDEVGEPAAIEEPPEPEPTPTITPTPTPSVPMVSVSVNTNCRTGPGTAYDLVGGLTVGETAQVVALSSTPNYVIIELPDGSGRECWLWMEYGTQTGDTTGLPVLSPPPTPTPPPPAVAFSMAFEDMDPCGVNEVMFYRVVNTGEATVRSYSISAENLDTAETVSYTGTGIARAAGCIVVAPPLTFEPGETGYITARFTPPIAGDTIVATITLCSETGLGGECASQSVSYTLGMPSDVNAKENFAPVDNQQILDDLLTIPITTWTYIDQSNEGRHIGPMAQDFNQTFGVGEYENMLQAVDIYGVAFASIQALAERNAAQVEQLDALQAQNEALSTRIDALERHETPWGLLILLAVGGVLAGWGMGRRRNMSS